MLIRAHLLQLQGVQDVLGGLGLGAIAGQLADLQLGELLDTPPPGLDEAVAIAKVTQPCVLQCFSKLLDSCQACAALHLMGESHWLCQICTELTILSQGVYCVSEEEEQQLVVPHSRQTLQCLQVQSIASVSALQQAYFVSIHML